MLLGGSAGGFRVYWAGQSLSAMGDAFALVAMPLLVLESTGSVAQMGLVSALGVLAQVLASIFAGPLVDRVDRRRLMIACDLGRALIYTAVPLLWLTHGPSLVALSAAAFVGGALGNVFSVAYVAAVPSLVGHDRLNEANAKLQGTQALAYVVGPLLAGIVAARTGAAWALGLDALSFLISVGSLLLVQAAGLVLIGLVPRAGATPLGALLWSGGMLVRAIPSTSLRQMLTPHALLGRVMSTFWALTFGASAIGTTLVTRAAAAAGARVTFLGIGLAVGTVALVGAFTAARTRHPEAGGVPG